VYSTGFFFYSLPVKTSPISACCRIMHPWYTNTPITGVRQLSAASERHRLSRVHRDRLIFTSSALKTWVLHVNTFYSWILLYISPVKAVSISMLSVLYIEAKNFEALKEYRSYSQVGHRVSSDLKRVSLLKLSDKILPGQSESESPLSDRSYQS
jgi:hypothetical protein